MNFFEQELNKIVFEGIGISKPTFAGRACYGDLGADNRVKLRFIELSTHHHYEALEATVLSRTGGAVDSIRIRFSDIWGKKKVGNPYYSNGIIPYIWTCDGKTDWHIYHPNKADYKQLAKEVRAYLDVFIDRSAIKGRKAEKKASVRKKLREAEKNPAPPKPARGKDHGPEL
jgi:hypothetical protein